MRHCRNIRKNSVTKRRVGGGGVSWGVVVRKSNGGVAQLRFQSLICKEKMVPVTRVGLLKR